MNRKTVLSVAFATATLALVGWEITAAADPHDDLEPWTDLLVDHVPGPVLMAAVFVLVSWLPGHFAERIARKATTMTIPATPAPGAPKEPLISVGFVVAAGTALLAVLVAFGLHLSDAQTAAILTALTVLAPLVVVLLGRLRVFSPDTVRVMVVDAARRGRTRLDPAPAPEGD